MGDLHETAFPPTINKTSNGFHLWGKTDSVTLRQHFNYALIPYARFVTFNSLLKQCSLCLCLAVVQGHLLHAAELAPPQRVEAGDASDSPLCLRSEDPPSSGEPGRAAGGRAHVLQPLLRLPHVAAETKVTDSRCQGCDKSAHICIRNERLCQANTDYLPFRD